MRPIRLDVVPFSHSISPSLSLSLCLSSSLSLYTSISLFSNSFLPLTLPLSPWFSCSFSVYNSLSFTTFWHLSQLFWSLSSGHSYSILSIFSTLWFPAWRTYQVIFSLSFSLPLIVSLLSVGLLSLNFIFFLHLFVVFCWFVLRNS